MVDGERKKDMSKNFVSFRHTTSSSNIDIRKV